MVEDYKMHYLDETVVEGGGEVKRQKFFHRQEIAGAVAEQQPVADDAGGGDSGDVFARSVRSIVGELESEKVERLRERSSGDVEDAVNMFFDGSFGAERNEQQPQTVPAVEEDGDGGAEKDVRNDNNLDADNNSIINNIAAEDGDDPCLIKPWEKRYIGSFQAECLATRSGSNLLTYGEQLAVRRIHPTNKVRHKTSKSSNFTPEDYVVRLANERGSEIARLGEQDARFASVLIDSGLCHFSAVGILADERVRMGDYMVVQVNCFILRSAFFSNVLPQSMTSTTTCATHDNAVETPDDKHMRLRQLGLANLFNKLNVKPQNSQELPTLETADLVKATETMGAPVPEESTNFGQDELDALYKRSEPPDTHLDPVEPPRDTFRLELRPYQKKGLNWMVHKEHKEEDDNDIMHPLWQVFSWPSQREYLNEQKTLPDGTTNDDNNEFEKDEENVFYVNLYSGELSLDFPRQKKSMRGGVLADEMGLGKTISTMALVHTCKYKDGEFGEDDKWTDFAKHTTLVVAPISLLAQWESEAYAASHDGSIRALVYYGENTGTNLKQLLCGKPENEVPNVLITSYGTLLSEHNRLLDFLGKKNKITRHTKGVHDTNWFDNMDLTYFGVYGVKFHRIVLDEAHTIRNRNSKTSKACYDLRAAKRWVLTGTPIVNKLEDLYSIVKFLRVEPWNNFSFWRAFITAPFESKGYVQAMNVVQSVMEPLVLRRTKDMKQKDGTPLVQLPPKTITIQRIRFSKDEEALYQYIFARVKSSFKSRLKQGSLMSSYSAMLTQILRLRQVCCHPGLITSAAIYKDNPRDLDETATGSGSDDNSGNGMFDFEDQDFKQLLNQFQNQDEQEQKLQSYGGEVMRQILQGAENECPICCTEPIPVEQQAVTECWHMSCLDCLLEHIEFQRNKGESPRCHTCRAQISADAIFQVIRRHNADNGEQEVVLKRYRGKGQSTKIKALINHLRPLYASREEQKPIKVVVFSQFTSFLDKIQQELEMEGYNLLRFDGSMNHRDRASVLEQFKETADSCILLLSLKAGGVGLNLVCATRAYMMDPWWSFAVESQAIDRIHRMGQSSEVQIVRFIVENSVEERMLKIQDRKKFLATTLGLSEEDKKAQRLEDIKTLFEM